MANLGYVGVGNLSQKMTKYYVGTDITYTPVEYITCNGEQFIDTRYSPNSNTKVEMQIKYNDTNAQALYNARDYASGSNINNYNAYMLGSTMRADYGAAGTAFSHTVNTTTTYTYIQDKNKFYENGTLLYTASTTTFTTTNALALFGSYYNGSFVNLGNFATYNVYYVKIYDNDTLVKDFIPVLDHNNVACLFDKESNEFYYGGGFGNFTYGTAGTQVTISDKARPVTKMYVGVANTYTPVEYIESSGTQFIDAGLKALDLITTGKIEEQAQYSNTSTRQQYGFTYYSSLDSTKSVWFLPIAIYNSNFYAQFDGVNAYTLKTADTYKHTFITDLLNNKAYIDSTQYTLTFNNTGTADGNIFLFGKNMLLNTFHGCSKKVYYTKIYNNEVLVRDFIPVVDSNNVACLYDKVEGKAYYNIGTGTFTAGNTTGEQAITGSYSRKIKENYTTEYFWGNIAPTSWSGTTTTAGYEFSSSNTYGTWKVSSTLAATSSSYITWKAVDSDNNSYLNTNNLTTLTLTLPSNVAILPRYFVYKTQYCSRIQVTGVEENTGREFLLFEGTVTSPSSATSVSNSIITNKYFTQFKVTELDRYGTNQVRLYAFRIDGGIVKVTGG